MTHTATKRTTTTMASAMTVGVLIACLAGCAGNGMAARNSASAAFCPAGSIKVCTSLYELSKERYPSCACSELISSR